MKVSERQKLAKQWERGLTKNHEKQVGQIPIVYETKDGKKGTGYISLLDLEFEVDGKEIKFGKLLEQMLNFNLETLKIAQDSANSIATIDNDLIVVENDKQGFVKNIHEYNAKRNVVIAKQNIPKDLLKGYYYVENGKFKLSEERKLELFPDFI